MFRRIFVNAIVVSALSLGIGCGAPSSVDNCHALCDTARRCGMFTDERAANCHKVCDANEGAISDAQKRFDEMCTNGADIRKKEADCLGMECNKVDTCLELAKRTECIRK